VFQDDKLNKFLLNYIQWIDKKNLRHKLQTVCGDDLYNQALNNYSSNALNIIIKPLMNEYYKLKAKNVLEESATRLKRWDQFLAIILTEDFITTFNEKYRVMCDQLTNQFSNYIQFCLEVIASYKNDQLKITSQYKDLGKIMSISTSFGDLHNGKSVSLITFEHGQLIYKPRNLNNDILFYNLTEWLTRHIEGITCKYPFLLTNDNYGWEEFITYEQCDTEEEVFHYYREAGVYLFLLYILNAGDMHYENLISHGKNPVIIDLETIAQAYVNPLNLEYGMRTLDLSVLSTMFIPYVNSESLLDFNLSALFSKPVISDKLEAEILIEDEELDWVFSKEKAGIVEGKNTVKFQDKYVESQDVMVYLIDGFKQSAEIVIKNKREFLSFLEKELNERMYKSRQVLRPTQVYHRYIEVSRRPELLSDYVAFDSIFDIFLNNFEASNHGYLRVEYEIEQMKQGNIPLFYTTFSSRHLYADDKIICENYYADTIEHNIIHRLQQLDAAQIDYQIELIYMSLASTMEEDNYVCEHKITLNNTDKDLTYIDKLIQSEMDYFKRIKIQSVEDNATFFILQNEENKFRIKLLGADLYQSSSIVLLIAYTALCYDDEELKCYACELLNQLNITYDAQIKNDKNNHGFSIFTGLGGLIYVNYNMYKLYGNRKYLAKTKIIIDDVLYFYDDKTLIPDDLDYMSGLGGLLVVIIRIAKMGHYSLTNQLKSVMQKYARLADKRVNKLVGVAHGLSGIMLALAECAILTEEKSYVTLIQELMQEEDAIIANNSMNPTWCRGASGVLYVRTFIEKSMKNHTFSSSYNINTINIEQLFQMNEMNVCHGLYGNVDVMYSIKKLCDTDVYDAMIYNKYLTEGEGLQFFNQSDYQLKTFMLGNSGILYELLRIKYDLPSILNLDLFEGKFED
jgi:type 2 lantibiotic biosynthesis protein LanM